ncbi:hypothetical protein M0C34_13875 [Agarivorans sp. TSD2052]|uniref:hypothetical protein n=1 Tax=Agarivorans sp. TSD2052 TaxID=2937286 RepID=UPI00200D12BE|nr:hypothetical protein [Agarivorans sp. TSD2052]UPW17327.1 hypothetical protein M0C34_13875 [Agarivorans sp. TSD2052]
MKDKLESLPNSFMAFKEYAMGLLGKYSSKEEDGALLIGNDTSVAPLYYKAIIWLPISRHSIARYEQINEIEIPSSIKELLSIANGFEVLGLRVCGLSKSMLEAPPTIDRTPKNSCLDLCNHTKHASIGKNGYFCFGSAHWSQNENVNYFITPEGEYVAMLKKGKEVGRWHSLESFISGAVSQAIEFDKNPEANFEKTWWKVW